MDEGQKLNVTLLLPGERTSHWLLAAAQQVADASKVGAVALFRPEEMSCLWPHALHRSYMRLLRILPGPAQPAFAPISPRAVSRFLGVDLIEMAREPGAVERDRVLASTPDILVQPDSREPSDALASLAPLGVLYLDHHDARLGPGSQFWREYYNNEPYCVVRLLWKRTGQPVKEALRTVGPTSAILPLITAWSSPNYYKAANLPARFLKQLAAMDEDGREQVFEEAPLAGEVRSSRLPGNGPMVANLARILCRHVGLGLGDLLFRRQWFLGYGRNPANALSPGSNLTPIDTEGSNGMADPFAIERDGKTYVFYEAIPTRTKRGYIAAAELADDGTLVGARPVVQASHHLSYPFVFEWEGRVLMLPESQQAGRVQLYEAESFPWVWKPSTVLLDNIQAADPTLLEHNGCWWLFANVRVTGGTSSDELSVYYADSPLGPFEPHPLNPVVSDVRSARPAGRFFKSEFQLYRPAQDCSGAYGRRVVLNRVDVLSPTEYRETPAAHVESDVLEGADCLHTYNYSPDLLLVDGNRKVSRLAWVKRFFR